MWQATDAQQARIDAVRDWARREIPGLWGFQTRRVNGYLKPPVRFGHRTDEAELARQQRTLEALGAALDGDLRGVADYVCFPLNRGLPLQVVRDPDGLTVVDFPIQQVLHECLLQHLRTAPDAYALHLLWARLEYMLRHPVRDTEFVPGPGQGTDRYHEPRCRTLGAILAARAPVADHPERYRALIQGDWCASIAAGDWHRPTNSYETQGHEIGKLFRAGMAHFRARGEFDYHAYTRLLGLNPGLTPTGFLEHAGEDEQNRELAAFGEDTRRHAWECLSALTGETVAPLAPFEYTHPVGGRWLVKVCELVEQGQVPAESLVDSAEDLAEVLTAFAGIGALAPGETEDDLAATLARFSPAVLWRVLVFAGAGRRAVLRALGQEALLGLHDWVFRTAGSDPHRPGDEPGDIPNGESTTLGVVDQAALSRLLAGVSDKAIDAYAKALKQSGWSFKNTLTLLLAFQGRNRALLEKAIARHGQVALRAYGLLPVKDRAEAAERYRALQRAWKECSKYGAERQANTRAAVTAGLANLASRAGYADPARMEWDLEAELGEHAMGFSESRTLGDWTVSLALAGIRPVLTVSKQGKVLKSVPAGLRKHPDFAALKEAQTSLKEQASRFRRTLERMMVDGEWIASADLARLARIPAVRALLGNLIGIDAADQLGLMDPVAGLLVDGEARVAIQERVRIAHVYDLYRRGVLSHWQQTIVRERRVQPFKQAFRELYLLTTAERESLDHSNRFAGHTVNTAIAYRLLQSRGWSSASDDVPAIYKRFPAAQLTVEWEFPEGRHFFTEMERLTSDRLVFRGKHGAVALTEIPPLILSETMRDADLVVSVANADDDDPYAHLSEEVQRARADVVRTLVEQLGLKGVSLEGNFVFVQGKLAHYRIHLGSGSIHIMPGNYLCIVPATGTGKTDRLYLPFADTDARTSEILSKILLLQNDQRIKDETILSQIRQAG